MKLGPRAIVVLAAGLAACESGGAVLDFHAVGPSDIEPIHREIEFTSIREIVVQGGSTWILDESPPFLTRIHAGGVERGVARGQGPGELLHPVALQAEPGGERVHVWDVGARRHVTFDAELEFVASEPLAGSVWTGRTDFGDVSYSDAHRVRMIDGRALFAHHPGRMSRTPDWAGAVLVSGSHDLRPEDDLARFGDLMGPTPKELVAVPGWDACGERVVTWDALARAVAWDATNDQRADRLELASLLGAPRLTESDIAAYLELMARLELGPGYRDQQIDFATMARDARPAFADRAPVVVDVRCESTLAAWLRLFDNRNDPLGRGARWLRVSPRGAVQAVEFPGRFRPHAFAGGIVLGSYEAPEGFQLLAEWRGTSIGS